MYNEGTEEIKQIFKKKGIARRVFMIQRSQALKKMVPGKYPDR